MRRMKVLSEEGTDPFWERNFVEQLGDRHDLSILDDDEPLAKQFGDIEVVIDSGGSVGTRQMMDAARDARLWQIVGTPAWITSTSNT